jgi:hypothetical protein
LIEEIVVNPVTFVDDADAACIFPVVADKPVSGYDGAVPMPQGQATFTLIKGVVQILVVARLVGDYFNFTVALLEIVVADNRR